MVESIGQVQTHIVKVGGLAVELATVIHGILIMSHHAAREFGG